MPPHTPRTLVIMPAWNEEAAIGETIRELRRTVPDYDLLVVNDGSQDRTSQVARRAGAHVLDLPYKKYAKQPMRLWEQ